LLAQAVLLRSPADVRIRQDTSEYVIASILCRIIAFMGEHNNLSQYLYFCTIKKQVLL
jgi:hypothetical protein